MQFTLRLLLLSLVVAFVMPSCVSKKKFDELMSEKGQLAESLAASQAKVQELEEKIAQLESDMEAQKKDFEGRISALESDLSSAKSDLAAAQAATAAKEAEIAGMKKEISDAFAVTGDLAITEQDGNLVVSLSSPVNYKSGSTRLDKDAREAIDALAETMKNNPSMSLVIEGHTDNKQMVEGAAYKDNWDLSVARAMKVVRRLVKKGVDPSQLAVSGKGEGSPAATNDEEDGRAQNRRTEVKPNPKAGAIYKLGGN